MTNTGDIFRTYRNGNLEIDIEKSIMKPTNRINR